MQKERKNKCSFCTAWVSSGKSLIYQLLFSKKSDIPTLTDLRPEIQKNFVGNIQEKTLTVNHLFFL